MSKSCHKTGNVSPSLTKILAYIQIDNPTVAIQFVDEIDRAISKLAFFPFHRTCTEGPEANSAKLPNAGRRKLPGLLCGLR